MTDTWPKDSAARNVWKGTCFQLRNMFWIRDPNITFLTDVGRASAFPWLVSRGCSCAPPWSWGLENPAIWIMQVVKLWGCWCPVNIVDWREIMRTFQGHGSPLLIESSLKFHRQRWDGVRSLSDGHGSFCVHSWTSGWYHHKKETRCINMLRTGSFNSVMIGLLGEMVP